MRTTTTQLYATKELNTLYEMLFCDRPELLSFKGSQKIYPWDVLLAHQPSISHLQAVADDELVESRLRLFASNMLLKRWHKASRKELLGVVIEVGMAEGLDTLAAYKDGSARYINHTGKMLFWETRTAESESLITRLFEHSQEVVNKIGPWDRERLNPPPANFIRLSFLVTDGLYFGQGPFDELSKDALAAPVIEAATQLLIFLTNLHQ